MKKGERVARLQRMADLVFDTHAARLREAAQRRDVLKRQIAALDRKPSDALTDPQVAPFLFSYESWAAGRRGELNIRLARAHAEWMTRLDGTRTAFGRQQVLKKLAGSKAPDGTGEPR